MQLAEWQDRFADLGVAVAGMTYDSVDMLATFQAKSELRYPLLRDEDVKHVNGFGIRNEDYEEGHRGYGIPYPGIVYIGADGTIQAKFAVPGYRSRPPLAEIHDRLTQLREPTAGAASD